MYYKRASHNEIERMQDVFPPELRDVIHNPECGVLSCYRDDDKKLIGTLLFRLSQDSCEILWISVYEQMRRSGIATTLYWNLLQVLAEYPEIKSINLILSERDIASASLFYNVGFLPERVTGAVCRTSLADLLNSEIFGKIKSIPNSVIRLSEMWSNTGLQSMWKKQNNNIWGITVKDLKSFDNDISFMLIKNMNVAGYILADSLNKGNLRLSYLFIDKEYSVQMMYLIWAAALSAREKYGCDCVVEMAATNENALRLARKLLPDINVEQIVEYRCNIRR